MLAPGAASEGGGVDWYRFLGPDLNGKSPEAGIRTDWSGGLRDRVLLSDAGRREEINAEIAKPVEAVQRDIFPVHGL